MKICIIGTGYVGLVAGACLADMGNDVILVDNDSIKLDKLNNGIIPIFEPGLEELVKSNTSENRLFFTSNLDEAVKKSDICFITVGTPSDTDGSTDLRYVLTVAKDIAKSMNGYKVIVNKSTVPVGTAEKVGKLIKENTNHPFDIVSNPEFLKQGSAVDDFLYPDRIIVGSDSIKAANIMQEIYSPFIRTGNKIIMTDIKSAEMIKYASNAYLATKISFINEIANLCECVGADIEMVRAGISADSRIGNKFLFPGLGFGGSCFPKDIKALIKTGNDNNCDMSVIKSVNEVNLRQRNLFVKKITSRFGENLKGFNFAVWGLSFKPKTDDMREAPSITIINELLRLGAEVIAYDPRAVITAKNIFGSKIKYTKSSYEALYDTNAMLLLTEWNEFRRPDFEKMKSLMKMPIIFDGRNQYSYDKMKEYGFEYYSIGRKYD